MDAFGIVVIGVLAVGVIAGLLILRQPVNWDELGGEGPPAPADPAAGAGGPAAPPTRVDDEADLRALVAAKRAARQAAGGAPVASDLSRAQAAERAQGGAGDWEHLDPEIVEEARGLIARRRARLQRTGKFIPDEHDELVRLLGPPAG